VHFAAERAGSVDDALRAVPAEVRDEVARANAAYRAGDLSTALAELDAALAAAGHPELHLLRAEALEAALADLDRAVALDPAGHRFARALLRLRLGRRAGAVEDLRALAASGPYPGLWLVALGADPGDVLTPYAGADRWPAPIARALLGRLEPDALLAEAQAGPAAEVPTRVAEARCYLGVAGERDGDRAAARRHYEAALATGGDVIELEYARDRLRTLGE